MFAVKLPGLGPDRYVLVGNCYPQIVAQYNRAGAEEMAAKCPPSYGATVVPAPPRKGSS